MNGALVDTKFVNFGFGATNTNPLYIGSRADSFTQFNGQIDDLRIYNTALSDAEVGGLAVPVPEPTTTLLAAAGLGLPSVCAAAGAHDNPESRLPLVCVSRRRVVGVIRRTRADVA